VDTGRDILTHVDFAKAAFANATAEEKAAVDGERHSV
jgi:hypothetical protein